MGRGRTKTVKKSSRQIIERYYAPMTLDFHTAKKILEDKKTLDMPAALGMFEIPEVVQADPVPVQHVPFGRGAAAWK